MLLAGCEGGVREAVGIDRPSPDEFAVVKRAPLEMTAEIGSLPPPRPGASRPQEKSPVQEAQQAVFGPVQPEKSNSVSSGEEALLAETGADEADSSIRSLVDQETAEYAESQRPVADRLLGLGGFESEAPARVVDPEQEVTRLRDLLKQPEIVPEVPEKIQEDE